MSMTVDDILSRCAKNQRTGCMEWQGPTTHFGYGWVSYGGRPWIASRLSYKLANGGIPKGLIVRHKCDNPPCCNPDHLEVGTYRDNTHDCMKRGRFRPFGDTLKNKTVEHKNKISKGVARYIAEQKAKGTPRIQNAKVTEREVRDIKRRLNAGESTRTVADSLGLKLDLVYKIKIGRTWGHVDA